jgi:predicted ATPase
MRQLQQGLAAHRATGSVLGHPYYLAMLAEAYRNTGQAEAGLSVVAEALGVVSNTGDRQYEAELYRLKGELLLQKSCREFRTTGNSDRPENQEILLVNA